jgi:hypothetical protein
MIEFESLMGQQIISYYERVLSQIWQVAILALIPCLPASAAGNETTITITLNTTSVIEIEPDKQMQTHIVVGAVAA